MRESLPQLEQMTNFFTYLSFLRLYVLNQKNKAHFVCLKNIFTSLLPLHVQTHRSTRLCFAIGWRVGTASMTTVVPVAPAAARVVWVGKYRPIIRYSFLLSLPEIVAAVPAIISSG